MSQPVPPAPDDDLEEGARDLHGAMRIDVEQIARLVYQLMLQDRAIEHERGAWRRAI